MKTSSHMNFYLRRCNSSSSSDDDGIIVIMPSSSDQPKKKPTRPNLLAFLNPPRHPCQSLLVQPGTPLHRSTPMDDTATALNITTYSTPEDHRPGLATLYRTEDSTDTLYVTCPEGNVAPLASPITTHSNN